MKRYLIFFVLVVCFSEASAIFSQEKAKSQPAIILDLTVRDTDFDRYALPIDLNKRGASWRDTGGIAKDTGPDYQGPPLGPGYSWRWKATVIDKNRSRINMWVRVDDLEAYGCTTRRTFLVTRKSPVNVRLGCGVRVVGYYGLESAEGDEH